MVSSTPRPHFTPGKDLVPNVQEAGWAQGSVWTGGKSRPHRNSIPDRTARSQSLYRLSYLAHSWVKYITQLFYTRGAQNIVKEIKRYQKKWLQHIQRMDTTRIPKKALQYQPKGRRKIGRPRKRWTDQLHLED